MNNSSDEPDLLDFAYFVKFLSSNGVFTLAVAAVLGERISDLMDTVISSLILPVINRDSDEDGVRDIKKIEDLSIEVFKIKFEVGKILISALKFVIITYFLYILSHGMRSVAKKWDIKFD
jgi:large-conductance mechanosensitive channel